MTCEKEFITWLAYAPKALGQLQESKGIGMNYTKPK
jgi:hypothetical protein